MRKGRQATGKKISYYLGTLGQGCVQSGLFMRRKSGAEASSWTMGIRIGFGWLNQHKRGCLLRKEKERIDLGQLLIT